MQRYKIALFVATLISMSLSAQNATDALPSPTQYTVTFISQHGEMYSVYVDGALQNKMPQSRVLINNVSDQTHEVVVVTKQPVEQAAVLSLRPGEPNVTVNVNYDARMDRLYLYTAAHNRPESEDANVDDVPKKSGGWREIANEWIRAELGQTADSNASAAGRAADEDEVISYVTRMRQLSFDSDRLALGKVLVAESKLTAEQIALMAQTIDYSQSQVEFLKYAYTYCSDKVNYRNAVAILTYQSDRRKVMDYVATQR